MIQHIASAPLTSVRSYDGSGNNQEHPRMNAAGETYTRASATAYADGLDAPSGPDRPNPRTISNLVCQQAGLTVDERQLSAFGWGWGQFLDHDLVLTPGSSQPFSIAVPAGDPQFDPQGTGRAVIPLVRSLARLENGRREQCNANSGWIDASMVYGSDPARAAALRAGEGGRLREGRPGYLPFNQEGLDNEDPLHGDPARLFLAGDRRANENLILASLQTLFLREHNRLAGQLAERFPGADDEELFQMARKVVGAQVQKITYDEFLPALLGSQKLPPYGGYRPDVDARIHNLFAAAAFRFGHSQVGPAIRRIQENGDAIPEGHLCLRAGFHQATRLLDEGGIDPILRGSAEYLQEAIDAQVVDDLRNFLFGPPGAGGLDLASINIARGRDHGLPDFNQVRQSFGLAPYPDFAALDPSLAEALTAAYGTIDQLDPWVGLLVEPHLPGSSVGETLGRVLIDQFTRLRDGDRFFYQHDPDVARLAPDLDELRLVDIVKRNTSVENIQDDLFRARDDEPFDDPCTG